MIPTVDCSFYEIEGSAALEEFMRQVRNEESRVNLTALWEAAGKSPEKEPHAWVRELNAEWNTKAKVHQRANGQVVADGRTAVLYILGLDCRLRVAYCEWYRGYHTGDVAKAIVAEPTATMGLCVMLDLMHQYNCPPLIAASDVLDDVVDRAAAEGMSEMEQETVVARAHRALRGDQQLPHPANPTYWGPDDDDE